MVMVNLPTAGVDYHVPFGGRKGSSYGPREQGQLRPREDSIPSSRSCLHLALKLDRLAVTDKSRSELGVDNSYEPPRSSSSGLESKPL